MTGGVEAPNPPQIPNNYLSLFFVAVRKVKMKWNFFSPPVTFFSLDVPVQLSLGPHHEMCVPLSFLIYVSHTAEAFECLFFEKV